MTSANLRRQDTTKGAPLRILSLDGGGVRGYSMLILLQELMHRTFVEIHGRAPRRHEIPKPCDHFDLIAGTGTGGLIAIMLGRLRLDLETCKDVYVRMTKRVFETDKTFAGIPYRSTLFKASKLEEAIRECVREHTIFEDEGNDSLATATPMTPTTPQSAMSGLHSVPQRSMSNASAASGSAYAPSMARSAMGSSRWGNPNALLYDVRENRTKTAVTAVYRGTPMNGKSALLRSYDSRAEPAPEFNCTIWQAGRATSATGLAFKPIQIGQSIFIDEGAGKYNPAPQILDEAAVNEYPGREVGVFISIGTGKRPAGTQTKQSEWWEGFMGGSMGDFAEARRRLIAKIEGCEETHQYMTREHLTKRNVDPENYYRLNVEVGVGEFGMNEWHRLSDISTNTRMYLGKTEVQNINQSAASKLGRIHRAKMRFERIPGATSPADRPYSWQEQVADEPPPPSNPMAIELPAEDVSSQNRPSPAQGYQNLSHDDKFAVVPPDGTQHANQEWRQSLPQRMSGDYYNHSGYSEAISSTPQTTLGTGPPPLPPKTPLGFKDTGQFQQWPPNSGELSRERASMDRPRPPLPYPDTDGPPPSVNMANKPQFGFRSTER